MSPRDRGGFTLIELLVVIVILGMLVALLFPSFTGAYDTLSQLRCAKNLSEIGKAYNVRAADERQGVVAPLAPSGWQTSLAPYVEHADIFYCPRGPSTSGAAGAGIGPRRLIVYSDPVGSSPIPGEHLPPGWMQWDDVDVWKEGDRGADTVVKNVVPGTSYELWFEDSWHNNTWNDLILRFTLHPDDSMTVTYTGENTGAYHYALCDGDTKEYLLPTDFPTRWMGVGGAGQISFGEKVEVDAPTGNTNYGLSSLATGDQTFCLGNRVILCLDYLKTVARGPTDPRKDDWIQLKFETEDHVILFARHSNLCNVLFTDGGVERVDPRDFDPMGPASLVTKYWFPQAQP